ncbi:MAG: hypothetical protein IOC90_06620 [Methylocystis sp.]|jgi:hypothetical protein|nr:hypothetical protein [Methylocystis sp.]MCA3587693.1 hypothetical protein [Methylocystis sp.]MCA3590803.1 hypothetical protein [Methylocystis sp.]
MLDETTDITLEELRRQLDTRINWLSNVALGRLKAVSAVTSPVEHHHHRGRHRDE